jgi:hypothetical protein
VTAVDSLSSVKLTLQTLSSTVRLAVGRSVCWGVHEIAGIMHIAGQGVVWRPVGCSCRASTACSKLLWDHHCSLATR